MLLICDLVLHFLSPPLSKLWGFRAMQLVFCILVSTMCIRMCPFHRYRMLKEPCTPRERRVVDFRQMDQEDFSKDRRARRDKATRIRKVLSPRSVQSNTFSQTEDADLRDVPYKADTYREINRQPSVFNEPDIMTSCTFEELKKMDAKFEFTMQQRRRRRPRQTPNPHDLLLVPRQQRDASIAENYIGYTMSTFTCDQILGLLICLFTPQGTD